MVGTLLNQSSYEVFLLLELVLCGLSHMQLYLWLLHIAIELIFLHVALIILLLQQKFGFPFL